MRHQSTASYADVETPIAHVLPRSDSDLGRPSDNWKSTTADLERRSIPPMQNNGLSEVAWRWKCEEVELSAPAAL